VRPRTKITIDSLYRKSYEKSIGRPTKMNDLHFFVFRGRIKVIALNSTLNISETVRDRGLVNPMDHQ